MSWLFALRLGRWGGAGFGVLAFALALLQTVGFYAIAGHTAAERAAFGRSMTQIATQVAVIIPPPIRPDTVGGYVQWRAYGALAILVAIWALASATGSTRGDEERGIVESVLATGVARADAMLWRFVANSTYVVLSACAAALGFVVGVTSAHDAVDWGALAGATLALVALALACYSIVLLVSQLTAARMAAAVSGAVLLALFLINSLSRTLDVLRDWRWLSPFHYFEASQPLAPGGSLDVRATEILFAIAAVAGLLAALAFAYRDLGSPLLRPPAIARTSRPRVAASPAWRVPVVRGLYDRRVAITVWSVGFAVLGAIFVELTRQMVGPLLSLPGLQAYFSEVLRGDIYPSFLGFVWFDFAQLLVAGFAVTQVARWSAEDADGRLEMALAGPVSRTSVVLERAAVFTLATLIVVAIAGAAVAVESQRASIGLNTGRLAAATLLLVPFATFFAAVGAALTARLPRATVGILGAVSIASYFLTQLGPVFKWPGWTENLSPFHLYGQPLANGVDGTGLLVMLLVTVVGFGAAAFLMQRRDIGS